jgi:hypothetical protein
MFGLTVNNIHLDQVLEPVAYQLDHCWWYLGGSAMTFPGIRPPQRVEVPKGKMPPEGVAVFQADEWERYLAESDAASREYANWIVGSDVANYGIGKPGFFSRYGPGMGGDWQMFCASDSSELKLTSFDEFASRFEGHWFTEPPDNLPDDICLITRDVDAAYLDLFFRDEWMFKAVWSFLLGKGMNPRLYQRPDFGDERRR